MRKNLLALTAALLGFTAAQAEPITEVPTIKGGTTLNFSATTNCALENNQTFVVNDESGNAAAKITGEFWSMNVNGVPHKCIAPTSENAPYPTLHYNISAYNTEDYRVAYFKFVITGIDGANITINYGDVNQSTSEGPVTIEGNASNGDPMVFDVTADGKYNKGIFESAVIILEPVIPVFDNGITLNFSASANSSLENNQTFIIDDEAGNATAKIAGQFWNMNVGGVSTNCIAPTSENEPYPTLPYTISAYDPEEYNVAYFRFVITGVDGANITVNYKDVNKSTSEGKVTIEGNISDGDPLVFNVTADGKYNKGIFESALIILVPAKVEEGEKAVTFDNTDANSKGTLTNNNSLYTTNNVPRITISGGMQMYAPKLTIAPSSKLGTDENYASWSEYTIAPYNTEKYRIKSCEIKISGFGSADDIKIYYNGTISSTENGNIITIQYPVDAPAAQADEVIADPVIKFYATTANGTSSESKKGEIVSASFVIETKNGTTTGVETITGVMNSEGEVIWYDLRGRRVENPANGIFVNSKGKKHIFAN